MMHLVDDFFDAFGPDKRFRVLIVGFDVILDRFDQVLDACEGTAANPFASDFAEPSFHQI